MKKHSPNQSDQSKPYNKLPDFPANQMVSVTDMGTQVMATILPSQKDDNTGQPTNLPELIRLSRDEYLVRSTGEVRQYRHHARHKSRVEDDQLVSLHHSVTRLNQLITCNFQGTPNELMLTLTYGGTLRDQRKTFAVDGLSDRERQVANDFNREAVKGMHRDLRNFLGRLKRRCETSQHQLRYVYCWQAQGDATMHLHVLVKLMGAKSFRLSIEALSKLWGLGDVDIKQLKNVAHIGAYVSSFMLNDRNPDNPSDPDTHYARLKYYPPNFKIFGGSINLNRPKKYRSTYGELTANNDTPSYVSATHYDRPNGQQGTHFKVWYEKKKAGNQNG